MYCRKMEAYAKDEKLLMQFFQKSLAGEAITWYTNLEPFQILSWKELMDAFIRQYQYKSDMSLIECSYKTCAREIMNHSKNMLKGEEIWQLK